jgi:hypothetical protein
MSTATSCYPYKRGVTYFPFLPKEKIEFYLA